MIELKDKLICVSKICFVHLRELAPGQSGNENFKRDNSAIYYIVSGELECLKNGVDTVVKAYDYFIWDYNDNVKIINNGNEKCVFYIVAFETNPKETILADFDVPVFGHIDNEHFSNLFPKIYHAWYEKKNGYLLKVCSLLYSILYNIISLSVNASNTVYEYFKIQKAVQYIYANYSKEIKIEDLCKISGYSLPHVNRLFIKHYKVSPGKFINNYRITMAKLYLENGRYTLSEIAEKVGMNSTAYFCRFFKKHTSYTPSEYRSFFLNKYS